MAERIPWTEEQTKLALYLYFQLPFGQLHSRNPEIVDLAQRLGRTPSSVAMKLANFASLDPKILESGRTGLRGASVRDRKAWDEFHRDWTKLVVEAATSEGIGKPMSDERVQMPQASYHYEPPGGATTMLAEVEQRLGQNFFRRAVLANFDNTCCVTGVAEPKLLSASHTFPRGNRMSPIVTIREMGCVSQQHLIGRSTDI